MIDDQVELKTKFPTCRRFSPLSFFAEDLVAIDTVIIANDDRSRIYESQARWLPHALRLEINGKWYQCLFHEFYKAVIGYQVREVVRLMRGDQALTIVLEIAESTLMEID